MGGFVNERLIAVLGPTNTGKTHYAIERMVAHSSGCMGFPLRLLAREVYDRVVAIKGKDQVALLTGEEKILPPGARYFLCTAESMPTDRDFAFVALDEAQLAADPERGHVFTDRLLRARGREETLILGSETLRPMLRALTPDAEIIGRPRFSTLSYAGPKKISRLPKRSVVVAFSAEEVYAVAEMLRRLRGGAAVVMGALSPRTRNAQVAMYQAGEVDYLVATDAIGMGLNMDVAHVAFASLRKFDGKRARRLTIPEMAQIAGRAGRHQRDGTFGTLGSEGSGASFDPEEVLAIEGHHFKPLDHLYWRNGTPDFSSVGKLIASLEARPDRDGLRAAPEAIDLSVLKRLAAEPDIAHRARGQAMTERLWAACGLPDFRKTGSEAHARLVARVFQHLSEGDRKLPAQWFADEIARLDTVQGDVETIADRIASARTWAYIAHRADWLAEPALWAERTRQLEEKLSDALHDRLTQRFVDRRTSVLLRDLDRKGAEMLPVTIGADGEVSVADEPIGHLTGFRFVADANARHADMKRLMAAAERRLGDELARRAKALAGDPDKAFTLATDIGRPVAIFWRGDVVARLSKGRSLAEPRLTLHRTLDPLSADHKAKVIERLERWLHASIGRHLAPLAAIATAASDKATAPVLRGLLAPVAEAGGIVARETVAASLPALDRDQRRVAAHLGLKIGTLDLFVPALLKPEPMRWRLALLAARANATMPPVPAPGAAMIGNPDPLLRAAAVRAGFRDLGDQMLRVDLVERLARHAHDARQGHRPFVPDPSLSTSLGLKPPAVARLMRTLGFAQHRRGEGPKEGDAPIAWLWRGRRPDRVDAPRARPGNAFGALARLLPPQAQGAHG
ncbi:helicase-related protein [Sphingomonas oryzagri]|uniref:Helicase-related protein n=1 Tax=Sphingomonas oryzagri TaxID=3042314 RepID=A0ABT6N5C6_9SPHN|nr:helicase-related protein [Sphingomonas oryzagri]MDH7640316.1 helicase-related protein [Sphingomonas oryzagri]